MAERQAAERPPRRRILYVEICSDAGSRTSSLRSPAVGLSLFPLLVGIALRDDLRACATAGCLGSSARHMLSCDIIQWLTLETCEMMFRMPVILRASMVIRSMCVRCP